MSKCLHGMDTRFCSHCNSFIEPVKRAYVIRQASEELVRTLREIGAICLEVDRGQNYPIIFKTKHRERVKGLHSGAVSVKNVSYCSIDCKDAYLQLTVLQGQDQLA